MSGGQTGYYREQEDSLLSDLDHTRALMEGWLADRFGQANARQLEADIRREYEALIPVVPYIPGFRAGMLNQFLLITAQELAVWKAMKKMGRSPAEAWEVCHHALRLRMAEIPQWKRWLMKQLMFSRLVKTILKGRVRRQERGRFGDFDIEYLVGQGSDYDIGVNYHECGNLNFMKEHGGEEFAPYICLSDMAMSDALGWGLVRTQTLADGCRYCDFRFKEGGETKITSQTPAVQEVADKISRTKDSS